MVVNGYVAGYVAAIHRRSAERQRQRRSPVGTANPSANVAVYGDVTRSSPQPLPSRRQPHRPRTPAVVTGERDTAARPTTASFASAAGSAGRGRVKRPGSCLLLPERSQRQQAREIVCVAVTRQKVMTPRRARCAIIAFTAL